MLDVGWSELLVIGVVALIVVGPQELPNLFRQMGRFTAKMRSMAREFSRAMEDAARDTGLDATAKDLKAMTSKKSLGLDALEQAATKFEKWQPTLPPASAKGPATQALADKQAAKAAARAADAAAAEAPAFVPQPDPAMPPTPKAAAAEAPAAKPRRKAAPAAKAAGAATPKCAPEVAASAEAAPAPKPRRKKTEA